MHLETYTNHSRQVRQLQQLEDKIEHQLISTTDFLGRNTTLNNLFINKYKNGYVEKIIMIK